MSREKNTVCIIETKKGCIFGGYTETVMDFNKGNVKDPNAFVFSIDKMKIYENLKKNDCVVDYVKNWGPIFRYDAFAVWDKNFFSYNGHTVGLVKYLILNLEKWIQIMKLIMVRILFL